MAHEMTRTDMRDVVNHITHFGCGAVVHKRGRSWWISFREFGFPSPFKTKTEAMKRASEWCLALARRLRSEQG